MAEQPAYAVTFHEAAFKEQGEWVRPNLQRSEPGPCLLPNRIEPAMPFKLLGFTKS